MKRSILFLLVIASLLLAACGGASTTTDSNAPAATTDAGAGTSTEATAASDEAADEATAPAATMEATAGAEMTPEATAEGAAGATTEATAEATAGAATGATEAAGGATGAGMAQVNDCTAKGPKVDNLVWWTRATEGDALYEHVVNVANAYTEAGGSPVEVVTVPDAEFKNKVSIAAPAGEGPDIMGPIAHDWVGEFALQEIALEIPQGSYTPDVFAESALNGATIEGKLYGLPLFVESVALIRNPDILPEAPATWDELIEAATAKTEGDTTGFIFPVLEQYHQYGILRGFGGYIFKYENGQYDTSDIGLNNAGAVEGFKFLRDLVHKQPFMPDIERQSQSDLANGKMEAGQGGATIQGPWALAALQTAGIPYDVDVLPTLPNGEPTQPFVGVQVYVPSAYSDNKEAALDLVNFAVCSNSVIEMYRGEPKVPARQDVLDVEPIASDPFVETWLEQAQVGEPLPNIPAMSSVWKAWGDAADAIITNNAPDEEIQGILDTAVQQIKDEIAKTQQ